MIADVEPYKLVAHNAYVASMSDTSNDNDIMYFIKTLQAPT